MELSPFYCGSKTIKPSSCGYPLDRIILVLFSCTAEKSVLFMHSNYFIYILVIKMQFELQGKLGLRCLVRKKFKYVWTFWQINKCDRSNCPDFFRNRPTKHYPTSWPTDRTTNQPKQSTNRRTIEFQMKVPFNFLSWYCYNKYSLSTTRCKIWMYFVLCMLVHNP